MYDKGVPKHPHNRKKLSIMRQHRVRPLRYARSRPPISEDNILRRTDRFEYEGFGGSDPEVEPMPAEFFEEEG